MRYYKAFGIGMVLVAMVGVSGCCGGGSTTVKDQSSVTTTTLGDELKALKDAYDQGIITEKEYNKSKEKIIKQRTE
jgi:hypothetical protein